MIQNENKKSRFFLDFFLDPSNYIHILIIDHDLNVFI